MIEDSGWKRFPPTQLTIYLTLAQVLHLHRRALERISTIADYKLRIIIRNMLRPQDILLVLKRLAEPERVWRQKDLAESLGLSQPEVSFAHKRLRESELLVDNRIRRIRLARFLVDGLPVVWPAHLGAEARGVPTAWALVPVGKRKPKSGPVWPSSSGKMRGPSVEPIYPTVPDAVARDSTLHRWLAMIDSMRVGAARERELARDALMKEIAS